MSPNRRDFFHGRFSWEKKTICLGVIMLRVRLDACDRNRDAASRKGTGWLTYYFIVMQNRTLV